MKKFVAILLSFICVVLFVCCNEKPKPPISEYVYYENDSCYLTLPISNRNVKLLDVRIKYLNYIDLELLKAADQAIIDALTQIKRDNNISHIDDRDIYYDIQIDKDNYLCLFNETIIYYSINEHEHKSFRERISLEPIQKK